MSEVMGAKELAERLRVTAATIHAWHRRGWIPAMQAGRRPVLFDATKVIAALEHRAAARRGNDAR